MSELARLYTRIALLQRGPQDLPASPLLLVITVLGYLTVNALVNLALPDPRWPWLAALLLDVAFVLAWYSTLLRSAARPERVLQTVSAIFGYRTVLAPLSVVAGWLIGRYGKDPTWQLPLDFGCLALAVWLVAANSHVLKAALEWPLLYCVGLVLAQELAELLVVIALVPLPR